jgi:hypothetical protein
MTLQTDSLTAAYIGADTSLAVTGRQIDLNGAGNLSSEGSLPTRNWSALCVTLKWIHHVIFCKFLRAASG